MELNFDYSFSWKLCLVYNSLLSYLNSTLQKTGACMPLLVLPVAVSSWFSMILFVAKYPSAVSKSV
jgi:hypothetical protein